MTATQGNKAIQIIWNPRYLVLGDNIFSSKRARLEADNDLTAR